MKRVIIALALFVAITMVACNTPTPTTETASQEATTMTASDFAYVSVEAVLAQCDIFKNEGVALNEKGEKARERWAQKENSIKNEAARLQEKYQRGLITSANAQKEQESIERKLNDFQTATQKEISSLEEENRVFANRTQDLLSRAVKQVNADGRYKMIVDASALIDADTTLNITNLVLVEANKLYAQDQKSSK
ncbi:MAG: OmpH family outer membrane protein [Rikenellaceae bacterium]